jgi:CheY-like chemotaxis protein
VVISAYSGEEALEKLTYEQFDLIILDLVLPPNKKTGLETLEDIRKINTDICVIITSAFATAEQAVEAVMEKGAQTYIKKPFKMEDVKQIVKDGLRWRKSQFRTMDEQLKRAMELWNQSLMKRCFITGLFHCGWELQENDKIVFVGMPFKDSEEYPFNDIYENSIKPAISHLNLSLWRADENMDNVVVMCKICQGIQKARYAVIDISDWNSNVLFEYGLVCGLGKRAILIKNKKAKVPTNLRGLEYISYTDDYEELKSKIIDSLGNLVEKAIPRKR